MGYNAAVAATVVGKEWCSGRSIDLVCFTAAGEEAITVAAAIDDATA